jgi:peptidoglycan/xylan/chitin deacetylase (PgdA/CDA1 family)
VSKRELVAALLGHGFTQPFWRLAPRSGCLRILAYHRVWDEPPETFAFDEELISANSEEFHRQMSWIKRDFEVLSFADLHICAQENRSWPRRALIVTFDDGYADNYTHAFPILKELNLPATIFLSTGYLHAPRLFWWDLIAYCVKQTSLAKVKLPAISPQALSFESKRARRLTINKILLWIKSVPDDVKNAFLDDLPTVLEVTLPSDIASATQLNWEQVREMAQNRIEFGGHSVTHPILSNIDSTQLEREIAGCKHDIETHLEREVLVFSYPNGQSSPTVHDAVQRAGYRFSTAYHAGVAHPSLGNYGLPRIAVETEFSFSIFQANLLFPSIMLRGLSQ